MYIKILQKDIYIYTYIQTKYQNLQTKQRYNTGKGIVYTLHAKKYLLTHN